MRWHLLLASFAAIFLAPALARAQITLGGSMAAGQAHFTGENGQMLLSVKLNGRGPYDFYFDTGSSNVLTTDVARELNLDVQGNALAAGFGKRHIPAGMANVASVGIGGFSLSNQKFTVMELPHHLVDRGNRPRLAGLIGGDFLMRYVVHIDFDRLTADFIPSGEFSYTGNGKPLDLSIGMGFSPLGTQVKPRISAAIEGRLSDFVFDTGNGGAAIIYPRSALADALMGQHKDRLRIVTPGGIGGPINIDLLRISGLEIAGLPVQGALAVSVMADKPGYQPPKAEVGTLGLSILRRFNLTIDYSRNHIFLEPRAKVLQLPKGDALRGTGLQLTKDVQDRFEVLNVVPGSPADRTGITAGDQIFEVNDKPASEMALFDFSAAEYAEAPISIALGSDAHRRTITLEKQVLLP